MENRLTVSTQFPSHHFRVDYDAEVDVLYISLQHPQKATDTIINADGVLLRYRADTLVGLTILEASTRT